MTYKFKYSDLNDEITVTVEGDLVTVTHARLALLVTVHCNSYGMGTGPWLHLLLVYEKSSLRMICYNPVQGSLITIRS